MDNTITVLIAIPVYSSDAKAGDPPERVETLLWSQGKESIGHSLIAAHGYAARNSARVITVLGASVGGASVRGRALAALEPFAKK